MCDVHLIFPDAFIQGRIQFFIDALDRAAQRGETEVLINRFPIDLELELGAAFTERTMYTGVYNILSDLGFDMSFRVQCSENYYGPNCTTFCESVQNLYTCDSGGSRICLQSGRDPATDCSTCLPEWDPETNCTTCLFSFFDLHTDCTLCLTGRDRSTNCTECLVPGCDPSTNCTECLPGIQCQSTQTTATTSST